MIRAAVLALILIGSGVSAQDTPRPPSRAAGPTVAEMTHTVRPVTRPDAPRERAAQIPTPKVRPDQVPSPASEVRTDTVRAARQNLRVFSPFAPRKVDRPGLRPAAIVAATPERRVERERGALCGDPDIRGEAIGTISGPGGCGVEGAVRVRSIAGVTLQSNPTIDCRTAAAMKTWITQGIVPAVGPVGGGVSRLRVVGHYVCRSRVGGSSGNRRMSEHAFGHAVDVAGIGLKNGSEITVLTDWKKSAEGAILRQIWKSGCGPFGTVLGPDANAAHRDHFHVDTARYRSGSYCR